MPSKCILDGSIVALEKRKRCFFVVLVVLVVTVLLAQSIQLPFPTQIMRQLLVLSRLRISEAPWIWTYMAIFKNV